MPTSTANATWEGALRGGKGRYQGQSGIGGAYTFATRFGGEQGGANPEELLAAAEASCYSMALSGALERAGATPESITTTARCTVEKVGEGMKITTMELDVRARVAGIDAARFQEVAEATKSTCPVSVALAGLQISVKAQLES